MNYAGNNSEFNSETEKNWASRCKQSRCACELVARIYFSEDWPWQQDRTKSSAAPGLRWKRPSFKRKLMMRHFLKLCFEHIQLFNNGWLRKKF
jgi:hypothetical protein